MKKLLLVFAAIIPALFHSQEKPELVVTTGHIKSIRSMDYHPSGKQIATSSDDNTIKIWDIALRQEFRTLIGHTSEVTQVQYTPNGKYIISKERNGPVIFWDSQTGIKLKSYNGEAMALPFSLSVDGKKLFMQYNDSLCLMEIPGGKIVASAKFSSRSSWAPLLSNNKQYLSDDGGNLGIFDFDAEDPKQVIAPLKGKIGSGNLIYSPATELAAAYNFKEVVLFDLKTGKSPLAIPFSMADGFTAMFFSSDGKKIVIGTNQCKIKIYDTQTGKELMTINEFSLPKPGQTTFTYCLGFASAVFSPDGKNLAINGQLSEVKNGQSKNKFVTLIYDLATGKRISSLEGNFKMIRALALVNSDKYLCTDVLGSSTSGLRFWNLKDGSIIKYIPGYYASFSNTGNKACIWHPDTVTIFTTNTFEILHKLKIPMTIKCVMSPDAKYMAALTVNTLNPVTDGLRIYDVSTGKQIVKYDVPHRNFAANLRISPDNKYLVGDDGTKLDVREFLTGKSLPQTENEDYVFKVLSFVPGTNQVLTTNTRMELGENFKILVIDYVTGKTVETFDGGMKNYIFSSAFSPDGKTLAIGSGTGFGDEYKVILLDWATKKEKCTLFGHHYDVNHIVWNNDGSLLYTASDDGTAKAWDINTCSEKGTFICMNGPEEYIIHSPDYYYKCSKGNYEGICFRYKGKLYRFDQFDLILNRPDIVMDKLGSSKLLIGMYKQAWKKRVKRLGFTEEMLSGTLSLPDAEVPGKENIAHTGGKIKFKVNAKDESSVINRINVFVNNVPVYGIKGMDVSSEKTKSINKEVSLDLSAGANQIDVSVINDKGLESAKESFRVDFQKPAAAKPDLYIFALGVSRFKDSKHDLKFPVKDSKDFINIMKSGTQFGKIEVVFIQDSVATKEKVMEASKVLEKAKIDDQVIIYISSHGLLDDKLDYFIAMYDVNFELPAERGLPYEEIENMLNKVVCRNRLVLIDACHSGEVDKEGVEVVSSNGNPDASKVTTKSGGSFAIKPKAGLKNSFSYMQALFSDVSKGSGATVISAAGGNEFALESKDWNNGVFTYSILKGLKNNEADVNRDKVVNISELKYFVIDKVSELTGGRQTPTARKENEINDFIIFRK